MIQSIFNKALTSHLAITLVIIFNVFHFIIIPWMGLMPQAAYYHFYGENWSLSYFDHPPLIGYLSRGFTLLLGKSESTMHLFTFIMSMFIQWSFYRLAIRILNEDQAKWALAFLSSSALLLILVFNSTPDVPLMLFWTLSIVALFDAIFKTQKWSWLLAGLWIGLAFDSKYSAILILPAVFAFILLFKNHRKWLITPWPYLMALIFLITISPVILWNVEHDFASFRFQSSERMGNMGGFQPKFFAGFWGTQLLLALPVIFYYMMKKSAGEVWSWISARTSHPGFFLMIFSFPFFVGFGTISFIYWVKINWTFPAFITGIILAAPLVGRTGRMIHFGLAGLIHILFALQLIFYLVPVQSDDTWIGWENLAEEVKNLEKQYPDAFVFAADDYKTTAQLIFYNSTKYYSQNIIGKPALHFDYLGDDLNSIKGKDAIFIDSDPRLKGIEDPEFLIEYFTSYERLEPIEIFRNGKLVRRFEVFLARKYLVH